MRERVEDTKAGRKGVREKERRQRRKMKGGRWENEANNKPKYKEGLTYQKILG